MKDPTRSLTDAAFGEIEKNYYQGLVSDEDVQLLIHAFRIQREVIVKLFSLFKSEPLRRVSIADPVRNSDLAFLRERVCLEAKKNESFAA